MTDGLSVEAETCSFFYELLCVLFELYNKLCFITVYSNHYNLNIPYPGASARLAG